MYLNLPWSREDACKIEPGHEDDREGAASHSVQHLHLLPQEMEHFLQINYKDKAVARKSLQDLA